MKAKQAVLLVAAGGALFLSGIGVGYFAHEGDPHPGSTVAPTLVSRENDPVALLERLREKDAELADLRERLETAGRTLSAPVAIPEAPLQQTEASVELQPTPEERARERMAARNASRAARLAEQYGLNDEQRAQLEDLYMRQADAFRARREGGDVEPLNMDAELAAILTEEQFAQYLADTQEEIYNRAELLATTSLVRLTQQVDLPQAQQEQVYDTIHIAAQEMMIAQRSGQEYDLRAALQERLAGVLNPEQLAAFNSVLASGRGLGMGGGPRP